MRRSLHFLAVPLVATAFTALSPLPAHAQETPDLCMGYVQGGQYASCRLVTRTGGELRCLCRGAPLLDVLVTGSIRRGPAQQPDLFGDGSTDGDRSAAPGSIAGGAAPSGGSATGGGTSDGGGGGGGGGGGNGGG
ncbi:hypothetical protein ACTZWW_03390, partial [Salinarimonas sp. NSM]|uniref:hypothetical protein n=1 Tax=Salinarimonas sp. NSM TaxID=3458003 RepID=UPI0040357156